MAKIDKDNLCIWSFACEFKIQAHSVALDETAVALLFTTLIMSLPSPTSPQEGLRRRGKLSIDESWPGEASTSKQVNSISR